jgi:ParB family chromosome partitioning protein
MSTQSTTRSRATHRPSPDSPQASPAGRVTEAELLLVDPKQLRTAANVRTDLGLTTEFVASVAQLGVLEPITARRDDAGELVIQRGHRRAAAAVQADLPLVRVLVEPGAAATEHRDEAARRVITQLVENDQRAGVSAGDRINAYSQLAAFGLKVGDIAKSTGAKKPEVEKALAVAGNDLASNATKRYDLTLDEAFVVSDFAGDKDAVKALIAAKATGQFDHVAQRLSDQRDYTAARDALAAQLTGRGVRIIEGHPGEGGEVRLSQLKHAGKVLDEDGHAACEFRAAHIQPSYDGSHVKAVEVCTDPVKAGHKPRYGDQLTAAPATGLSEAQKKERREVRENNTAWRSAEKVRRQFLAKLMAGSGKSLPPGTRRFIAESLADGDYALRRAFEQHHPVTREILKLSGTSELREVIERAADAKAELLGLGTVLGAYEAATGVHTWRQPTSRDARYFGFLRAAGYTLSPVEEGVAPKTAPPSKRPARSANASMAKRPAGARGWTKRSPAARQPARPTPGL